MKVSSATDSNNNSLVVEEKDEEATSGVEIIATETEESLSADATKAGADVIGHQKPKPRGLTIITVGSLSFAAAAVVGIASFAGSNIHSSKQQVVAALMNEEVDGYEFVANGVCVDGGGNPYDRIAFEEISNSPQACGERCSGCPGGGQAGLVFRGFTYYLSSGECYCLVDDAATNTPVTLQGACEDYDTVYAGNEGSGKIQGADGNRGVCYKKSEGGKSKSSKRGKANNEAGGM